MSRYIPRTTEQISSLIETVENAVLNENKTIREVLSEYDPTKYFYSLKPKGLICSKKYDAIIKKSLSNYYQQIIENNRQDLHALYIKEQYRKQQQEQKRELLNKEIEANINTIKHFVLDRCQTIGTLERELELRVGYFHYYAPDFLDSDTICKVAKQSKFNRLKRYQENETLR